MAPRSLPGLTRQSIILDRAFWMDALGQAGA